jgi:hypothetical protein
MKELKIIKQTELYAKRLELYKKQKGICFICKKKVRFEKTVLDHQHKHLKSEVLGVGGVGQIRGVLCSQCNSWEGKIANSFIRYGLHKMDITITDLLINLADYLEMDKLPLIHHTEVKKKIVSKANYNKLKKVCTNNPDVFKKKFPEYPKSKKLTKALSILFKEFNIDPYIKL